MKIGEKVKLLDEEGTAIIKELRRNTAVVEDEFGFRHELNYSEFIVTNEEIPTQSIHVPEKIINTRNIKKVSRKILKEELEIDLHIGHLVDYPNQFTAHEKFEIQIKEAVNAIQKTRGKFEKLILIHGKGSGKLEAAIHEILQKTPKIRFKEADFNRYKLGAVEIYYI